MRELTKRELAAMWIWHEEYAAQRDSAIAFYKTLSAYQKRTIESFIEQFEAAPDGRNPAGVA